jgi:hypothetical protein
MGRQKPRKPKRVRPARPDLVAALEALQARLDSQLDAQLVRSTCSSCGSDHLHWGTLGAAVEAARTDAQRVSFVHAVAGGLDTSSEAWWCMDCTGVGIFSAVTWG